MVCWGAENENTFKYTSNNTESRHDLATKISFLYPVSLLEGQFISKNCVLKFWL